MAILSPTTQFLLWRFYRTRVLPVFILVALLSILFGGALVVEDRLSGNSAANLIATGALNRIVITNLFAASLLMLCHAVYLTLMAYQLVYRFPIERPQLVSLVYIIIVFAYFAHARHAYLDATDARGIFEGAWWSSAAFVLAYFAMACHGLMEHGAEEDQAQAKDRRLIQHLRGKWLLRTDIAVCLFAALMLVRSLGWINWDWLLRIAPVRFVLRIPVVRQIYAQASPKDAIIIVALCTYGLLTFLVHRRLRRTQTVRSARILDIQKIDSDNVDWKFFRSALPESATWLDLASGQGKNLYEIIGYLYQKQDTMFPKEVIFLDRDCSALIAASAEPPASWPTTAKRTCLNVDIRSRAATEAIRRAQVVHMGHTAYEPAVVRAVLHILRSANPGTFLLVRYTSNASFYRVISASTSCAVWRPYLNHYMHPLLLKELLARGWEQCGAPHILPRYADIEKKESRESLIDWCDAQYGEFSGDIIERYVQGFAADGQTRLLNADTILVLKKSGSA